MSIDKNKTGLATALLSAAHAVCAQAAAPFTPPPGTQAVLRDDILVLTDKTREGAPDIWLSCFAAGQDIRLRIVYSNNGVQGLVSAFSYYGEAIQAGDLCDSKGHLSSRVVKAFGARAARPHSHHAPHFVPLSGPHP